MSKQVRSMDDYVACEVCGRTMLKGEHPEPYLAPSRERKLVCQLCAGRAQQEGWIRESANPATPAQPPRSQETKRRFRRGRRAARAPVGGGERETRSREAPVDPSANGGGDPARGDLHERVDLPAERAPLARFRRDPRHVRAVPTNAQLKIERAVALFNGSEHPRTVAGIARTLGSPQVCASTSADSAAEVRLTVAWELSWYQFVVDLSDTNDPVQVEARGHEMSELEPDAQAWNASAAPDGSLLLEEPKGSNGEQDDEHL
jgi:hypothetical protein